MYIHEIEIENVRCFQGKHTVCLMREGGSYAGWTVFAGRNGTGKSTLLKALALAVVGPQTARGLVSSFPRWVHSGKEEGSIAIQVTIDRDKDTFQGKGSTTFIPFWLSLKWVADASSDLLKIGPEKNPKNVQKAPERGPWADKPKGWMIVGYGPYRHIGPMTVDVAQKKAVPLLSRLVSLFSEATLVDAITWMKEIYYRSLEKKLGQALLLGELQALLSDGLLPDGGVLERIDSEGLWISRHGVSLPLEQFSDGYKSVAALVVDLARHIHEVYGTLSLDMATKVCPLPGVVLIDEVDAHLHPSWQQKIGFWLTKHFPNIQFLVTTHSPFVCQAASPNGIIRLPAPGEQDTIRPVSPEWFTAIVNGSADDAVISELFGLEHPHSERAEKLRRDVARLEEKVLRKTASPEEKSSYIVLKAQLPDNMAELADRVLRRRGE